MVALVRCDERTKIQRYSLKTTSYHRITPLIEARIAHQSVADRGRFNAIQTRPDWLCQWLTLEVDLTSDWRPLRTFIGESSQYESRLSEDEHRLEVRLTPTGPDFWAPMTDGWEAAFLPDGSFRLRPAIQVKALASAN